MVSQISSTLIWRTCSGRRGRGDPVAVDSRATRESSRFRMLPSGTGLHQKTGAIPINHMVSVRKELAASRPDVIREIYRMLHDPAHLAARRLRKPGLTCNLPASQRSNPR